MGLVYFLSFFTLVAAAVLAWALWQLYHVNDNQLETS